MHICRLSLKIILETKTNTKVGKQKYSLDEMRLR